MFIVRGAHLCPHSRAAWRLRGAAHAAAPTRVVARTPLDCLTSRGHVLGERPHALVQRAAVTAATAGGDTHLCRLTDEPLLTPCSHMLRRGALYLCLRLRVRLCLRMRLCLRLCLRLRLRLGVGALGRVSALSSTKALALTV